MKKIFLLLGVTVILNGCALFQQVKIDYLPVSVPEEGSIKFTQYTTESEKIIHPEIFRNSESGMLNWYAPSLLTISPDGSKICYLALSNEFKNLYIKDIGGGRSTIQRTFNRDIMDMSYSPDGKYIVFTDSKAGNENIYMINATEGVAVQQLVATAASELSPFFSKDSKDIFFAKSEGDRYFIWSLNIESSLLTQYTEGFTPCLAPNGEDLIVTRNNRDQARGEIWMINLKKGTETLILSDPRKGYSSPRISPDGKRIVCVGVTEGDKTKAQNLDLFVVNIDGSKLTQLTFHGGHDCSPVWTPDGKSIFFLAPRGNREGLYNVWKMDLPVDF